MSQNGYTNGDIKQLNGYQNSSTNGMNGDQHSSTNGMNGDAKKEPELAKLVAANGVSGEVEGSADVKQENLAAYLRNYRTHQKGISHEQMVKNYTDWANNYDEDLCPGRYNGPEIAAEAMSSYYTNEDDKATLRILDVAAGTGRVGQELHSVGFRNVDALEPSEGMLQILIGRGIYKQTYLSSIGYGQIEGLADNTYDSLVIAGGMGEGHIPISAFKEMIRIVKQGGTIFIVMREEYLTYVQEYVDKLEPAMTKLEDQGLWKQLSRKIVPNYSFNKNGIVYNYQVL